MAEGIGGIEGRRGSGTEERGGGRGGGDKGEGIRGRKGRKVMKKRTT